MIILMSAWWLSAILLLEHMTFLDLITRGALLEACPCPWLIARLVALALARMNGFICVLRKTLSFDRVCVGVCGKSDLLFTSLIKMVHFIVLNFIINNKIAYIDHCSSWGRCPAPYLVHWLSMRGASLIFQGLELLLGPHRNSCVGSAVIASHFHMWVVRRSNLKKLIG